MAFPATHLKFAAAKESELGIENKSKYYSGTLYPDSRYVTKIDREKTHYPDLLPLKKHEDDFKKGWAVHYLCDQEQFKIVHDVFQRLEEGRKEKTDQWWVNLTSVKLAQDIVDLRDFKILNYLEYLNHVESHLSNESKSKLKEFNDQIGFNYSKKINNNPKDYQDLLLFLGNNKKTIKEIVKKAKILLEKDIKGIEKASQNLFKNL